jgi:hypothetical protein
MRTHAFAAYLILSYLILSYLIRYLLQSPKVIALSARFIQRDHLRSAKRAVHSARSPKVIAQFRSVRSDLLRCAFAALPELHCAFAAFRISAASGALRSAKRALR